MPTPIEKLYLTVTEENLKIIKKNQEKIIRKTKKIIDSIEKAHKRSAKSKLKFDRKQS